MSVKNITYRHLKAIMLERAGEPRMPSTASIANTMAALNGFQRERNLTDDKVIGGTLRGGFYGTRDAHLARLRGDGRSKDFVKDRKSRLGHWHRLIRALDHEGASIDGTRTPLQLALAALFADGRQIKPTARKVGMSYATLTQWIKGALPRFGTEHHLKRLEAVCELAPGALTDLLPYAIGKDPNAAAPGPVIAYRERLVAQIADEYRLLKKNASLIVREEWQGLISHKSSIALPGARSNVSPLRPQHRSSLREAIAADTNASEKQWRVVPMLPPLPAERWIDAIDGRLCRTAAIGWSFVAGFFGWALLSIERGGAALAPEALTLGLLCDTDLILSHLEWREARSGGINGSITTFLKFTKMLCNPVTGYLLAHPEIGERVGVTDPKAWRDRCIAAHVWMVQSSRKIERIVTVGRDPKDPLLASLDMEMPLDNFVTAVRRCESCRPSTGGEWEAVWARDLLLLALTMSNPLRVRNLRELTYRPDNTGQLRKNRAGEWRIFITRPNFKNVKGAAKDKDYDQAVDPSVWPYIERYLADYRAVLGGSRPELVFVSSVNPNVEWEGLDRRYFILTKRYVPGCPGVGPHSIRHIVATSIIIKTGDFLLAADTLHDKPATVQKHYALLLASVGDRGRRQALGDTYDKVSERHRRDVPKKSAA
jgi:hypothetical protein